MGIRHYNFASQSALFARLSATAYLDAEEATTIFTGMGFSSTFYATKGSQAYVVEDADDVVVVCRGTEVKEWSDIKADASIDLVEPLVGEGQVHRGFKWYTDLVWPDIYMHILQSHGKSLWLTGHSLGAAMATLLAQRCAVTPDMILPSAVFTYGSPRVGNREFINHFNRHITHHRWVNDGDLVTKVPISPWYYHSGTMHHIDSAGKVTVAVDRSFSLMKVLAIAKTVSKGLVRKVMGDLKDHSSANYVQHLGAWAVTAQEVKP